MSAAHSQLPSFSTRPCRNADALVATEAILLTSVTGPNLHLRLRLRCVGVARAARQGGANFSLDLGVRVVDAVDAFHHGHDSQARSAVLCVKRRIIGDGEHPAPDQQGVRRVKSVASSPFRCVNAEAALVDVPGDCRVRRRRIALERQW